ncbi:adenine deaminase C-terminal domain-containing protein [Chloroflexota bacterium]
MPRGKGKTMTLSSEEMSQLVKVSLGEEKADLAITDGALLNVYTGELLEGYSVAVKGERIAYVGREIGHTLGPETEVIEATGKTLIPGLIDGHTHLIDVYRADEFLRYAMRGGTTSIITETLEFSFPLGYRGILQFLESIRNQPIKIFASLPAMMSLSQTAQANAIGVEDMRKLLRHQDVIGLGENYWRPIVQGDRRVLDMFAETLASGKKIAGHTSGASGNKLQACLACGICDCHEPITAEETLERLRLGIHVLVREGEIRRDLTAISKIKDHNIDFRRLALCTDGTGPRYLMEEGYMEFVVQKAIDLGFDPVVAIQMATINIAEHLSLDGIIGGIAPGKYADIVLIPDLRRIEAEYVISNGRVIARKGQLLVQPRRHRFPKWVFRSIQLPGKLEPASFAIPVESGRAQVEVRVIDQVSPLLTREVQIVMPVRGGVIEADVDRDILKVAAIDFRNQPGKMFVGLVRGFKMKKGAFATSGAWDISNIIVVGTNDDDIAQAASRIVELQGGIVVCADGQVLAELPLPIAGLLSDLPVETIRQRLDDVQQKVTQLGVPFPDAHLTLAVLTTPAVPFLRICEEGLVNIREGKSVDLIVCS